MPHHELSNDIRYAYVPSRYSPPGIYLYFWLFITIQFCYFEAWKWLKTALKTSIVPQTIQKRSQKILWMLKNDPRTTGVMGDMASMACPLPKCILTPEMRRIMHYSHQFPDEKRVSVLVVAPHLLENRSHSIPTPKSSSPREPRSPTTLQTRT